MTQQLRPDQVKQLYDKGGFLILDDLPPGSTFGIDGSAWQIGDRFRGVKILPPGLHLIMASASSSATADDPETLSAGIGVRHGLVHFLKPQEVLLRRWDAPGETFERPKKRVRLATTAEAEVDVVSADHLKSIDGSLAAYPLNRWSKWQSLTSHIDEACVGRVLGFDQRGDAAVDALMGALGEADGSETTSTQTTWGKPRDDDDEGPNRTTTALAGISDAVLRFIDFDLKRSWRSGAVGEEISLNARDKSWLLLDVVKNRLNGDSKQLLAELQLAFILFVNVHSFSSLEAYKRIASLICRSTTALAPSSFTASLPHLLLTDILLVHIELLQSDTAAHELAELDAFFASELNHLRVNLRAAGRTAEDPLREAWTKLDAVSGYGLGKLDAVERPSASSGIVKYDLLRTEGESEDEDDDDKPQVVMLDEAELVGIEEASRSSTSRWREDDEDEVEIRL